MFLLLFVHDELSYDRYHENADNIYRVVSSFKEPDNAFVWPVAQIPFAPEVKSKYQQVRNAVRFFVIPSTLYRFEEKRYYEDKFYLADSTVFDMFSWDFIAGDPQTALDNPNSLVITRSIAVKYFGTEDCLGKTLTNTNNDQFNITGVMENIPRNSHFRFDALISRNTRPQFQGSWDTFRVFTYLELPDAYNYLEFQPALDSIVAQHVKPIFQSRGISIRYELQPITSIHLYSKIQHDVQAREDINTIYIFSIIAVLMLLIACINYMNLATARYSKRAREVGIRKVAGSSKLQLVLQFLSESLFITLLATILSVFLIYLFLPLFNDISGKQIPYSTLFETNLVLLLAGIALFAGILGGSYPAFYLSSFKAVNVLKGRMTSKGGMPALRKTLVIVQFFISLGMLTSTLVVYKQLEFLSNKDLGFNKEQVVLVNMPSPELRKKFQPLKNELLTIPKVRSVSTASQAPGNYAHKGIFGVETNDGIIEERSVDFFFIDFDFVHTLGMEIIEGRNLDEQISGDTIYSVLVNEEMVSRMNWDKPLGKKFRIPAGQDSTIIKEVVGVVKNYHQNSLHNQIEPLMVMYLKSSRLLYVKIDGNDISNTMQKIKNSWQSIHPDNPFDFTFLNEDLEAQYDQDERRGKLFAVFSALAIFIACLGLLGLTAFTTEQRNKEISIRKVNGASNWDLIILMSKDYFKLVLLGTAIALPVAWYFMDNWLENFAYKIILLQEVGLAIKATLLIIMVALLTVGYHTIRAANKNPASALQSD